MTNSQLRISIPHNEYRKTGNGSPSPTYMQSPSMYSRSGYEIARLKWLQRRDYRRKVSPSRSHFVNMPFKKVVTSCVYVTVTVQLL